MNRVKRYSIDAENIGYVVVLGFLVLVLIPKNERAVESDGFNTHRLVSMTLKSKVVALSKQLARGSRDVKEDDNETRFTLHPLAQHIGMNICLQYCQFHNQKNR